MVKFIGKVVAGRIEPLWQRCAAADCERPAAGRYTWDEYTSMYLCEVHAEKLRVKRADDR